MPAALSLYWRSPEEEPPIRKRLELLPRLIWRTAPSGLIFCTAAGLANGAIWSLAPDYGVEHGFPHGMAGELMGTFVLGGILMPFPLGWVSDRVDRRFVMLAAALSASLTGLSLALSTQREIILGLILLYGMSVLPLYALGVAWTNDRMPRTAVVGTAATLLFFNSLASLVAPLVAGLMAHHLGSSALFGYTASIHLMIALWVFSLILRKPLLKSVPYSP